MHHEVSHSIILGSSFITLANFMTPHSAAFCHKHVVTSYQPSSKHDHKQISPWHPTRPKASLPRVRCEIPLQCCKICVNPQLVICCPRECPRIEGGSWLFLLEDGHTKRSGEFDNILLTCLMGWSDWSYDRPTSLEWKQIIKIWNTLNYHNYNDLE